MRKRVASDQLAASSGERLWFLFSETKGKKPGARVRRAGVGVKARLDGAGGERGGLLAFPSALILRGIKELEDSEVHVLAICVFVLDVFLIWLFGCCSGGEGLEVFVPRA